MRLVATQSHTHTQTNNSVNEVYLFQRERKSCFDVQATERPFRQHLSRTASLQQESRPPRSPEDGAEGRLQWGCQRTESVQDLTQQRSMYTMIFVLWSTSWTQKRAVLPEETNLSGWVSGRGDRRPQVKQSHKLRSTMAKRTNTCYHVNVIKMHLNKTVAIF